MDTDLYLLQLEDGCSSASGWISCRWRRGKFPFTDRITVFYTLWSLIWGLFLFMKTKFFIKNIFIIKCSYTNRNYTVCLHELLKYRIYVNLCIHSLYCLSCFPARNLILIFWPTIFKVLEQNGWNLEMLDFRKIM